MSFNYSGIVLQKSCKEGKSFTAKYYRKCVLAAFSHFHKRMQPNTGMHGVKLLHDNALRLQVQAPAGVSGR